MDDNSTNGDALTVPTSDSQKPDGPCHPFSWRQNDEVIGKMRTGSWKMVKCLWSQDDRTATFGNLLGPVYDDREHVADASAFGSLCKSANQFFKEHQIPWRARIKDSVVYLEPTK